MKTKLLAIALGVLKHFPLKWHRSCLIILFIVFKDTRLYAGINATKDEWVIPEALEALK